MTFCCKDIGTKSQSLWQRLNSFCKQPKLYSLFTFYRPHITTRFNNFNPSKRNFIMKWDRYKLGFQRKGKMVSRPFHIVFRSHAKMTLFLHFTFFTFFRGTFCSLEALNTRLILSEENYIKFSCFLGVRTLCLKISLINQLLIPSPLFCFYTCPSNTPFFCLNHV